MMNRRQFLAKTGKVSVGLASLSGVNTWEASQRVIGANERVRLAVCGVRKRGFDHVRLFSSRSASELGCPLPVTARGITPDVS